MEGGVVIGCCVINYLCKSHHCSAPIHTATMATINGSIGDHAMNFTVTITMLEETICNCVVQLLHGDNTVLLMCLKEC